jgi:hypothetical protein
MLREFLLPMLPSVLIIIALFAGLILLLAFVYAGYVYPALPEFITVCGPSCCERSLHETISFFVIGITAGFVGGMIVSGKNPSLMLLRWIRKRRERKKRFKEQREMIMKRRETE